MLLERKTKRNEIRIVVPDYMEEIELCELTENKREAIKQYDGKIAMILDFHQSGYHYLGCIRLRENDDECYELVNGDKIRRFHFDDLERLAIFQK
jgi:hypothetical protein